MYDQSLSIGDWVLYITQGKTFYLQFGKVLDITDDGKVNLWLCYVRPGMLYHGGKMLNNREPSICLLLNDVPMVVEEEYRKFNNSKD